MSCTTVIKLTGQSLLNFVEENKDKSKTELVLNAGYIHDNGKPAFVEFYTELLKAKDANDPSYLARIEAEDAHYESLDSDTQDLYDIIHDRIGEKWDHDDIIEFIDELDDIGIETADQFNDAFYTVIDYSHNAEAEFAEKLVNSSYNIPEIVVSAIDWQAVWNAEFSYDYNTIEFDGSSYFFRNL